MKLHRSRYARGSWVCGLFVGYLALVAALSVSVATAGAAAYECLTTPNGIPRKVIVKKENVKAYDKQDFSGKETPLKFFRKYFVFKESGQGLQVGEATVKAAILGWVRRDDILPWDTEQALFFINKKTEGREPVRIWPAKEQIGKRDVPHFEEQLDRDHTTEPFPVLSRDGALVEIAFLWDVEGPRPAVSQDLSARDGDQTTAALVDAEQVQRGTEGKPLPGGQQEAQELVAQAQRMDFVLVIDVTGSMGPYINEVRSRLITIVESLGKMAVEGPNTTIHIGVVAYRDYGDAKTTFQTKELPLTTDKSKVLDFLRQLAPGGGGDTPEAVEHALFRAVEGMGWGEHAFKVMVLVTDAPPHTGEDSDIRKLKESGQPVASEFFKHTFEENLKTVTEAVDREKIQLYVLAVAKNEELRRTLGRFVTEPARFLSLANAREFITTLDTEMRKRRTEHGETLGVLDQVVEGTREVSALTDLERFRLKETLNIDPAALVAMKKEKTQRGWFNPKVGADVAIAVYLRRSDLEEWAEQLRTDLLAYREKEEGIFKGIIAANTGPIEAKGIPDLMKIIKDVAYTPEILKLENLGMEDAAKVKNLRRKLNNIMILLLSKKIFDNYDEGWIPMDYLPGSLSDPRK